MGRRDGRRGAREQAITNPDLIVTGMSPFAWFSGRRTTLSGANVLTVPNRVGSGLLTVETGTVTAPVPDSRFKGKPSILLTGTQRLASDATLASWKFLHDNSGCEIWNIYALLSATNTTWGICGTSTTGTAVGLIVSGYPNVTVGNGASRIIDTAPGANMVTANAPVAHGFWYGGGQYGHELNAAQLATGAAAGPSSADPSATFRLGFAAGAFGQLALAESIVFNRVLTVAERAKMRTFARTYGAPA